MALFWYEDMWSVFLSAAWTIMLCVIIFGPLQYLVPIVGRSTWLRQQWWTDVFFLLGNFLVWTPLINVVLVVVLLQGVAALPLEGWFAWCRQWPWVVHVGVALLCCDLATYWFHRLSHQLPLLWRFHQTHHSAEHLDWIAAYREHPVDNILTRLVENAPLVLLGVDLTTIAGLIVFRGLWALYIHSNIAIDPGWLRYFLGAPRLHHYHHEVNCGGQHNYANLNPLMDLIFGTYHDPKVYPKHYGICGHDQKSYWTYLLLPFWRR